MGQWVGAQGRPKVTKISKTCAHCDVTSRKSPTKTKNVFFSMSTRRLAESVEGLNSSLALAAGDLWPKKGRPIAVVQGLSKAPVFKRGEYCHDLFSELYWNNAFSKSITCWPICLVGNEQRHRVGRHQQSLSWLRELADELTRTSRTRAHLTRPSYSGMSFRRVAAPGEWQQAEHHRWRQGAWSAGATSGKRESLLVASQWRPRLWRLRLATGDWLKKAWKTWRLVNCDQSGGSARFMARALLFLNVDNGRHVCLQALQVMHERLQVMHERFQVMREWLQVMHERKNEFLLRNLNSLVGLHRATFSN